MNKPLLNDKEIYPDNEVIKKYLFDTFDLWMKFIDILRNDYPEYNTEWRYYNDGKSWLFKVTHKKKRFAGYLYGVDFLRQHFILTIKRMK